MTPHRPNVCVLHVGGTIAMLRDDRGHLVPQPGYLSQYLQQLPERQHPELPSFEIIELSPLLDSAEMNPQDWLRIAQSIIERQDKYDGFVVIHGTDTMAYTASALSFLLPGLHKPIVMTGSQLSLISPRSDGREHLITSLILAGHHAIPEVTIYSAQNLLRGNRSQKIHNHDFIAFHSANFPALARVGVDIEIAKEFTRSPGSGLDKTVSMIRSPKVAAFRIYPGLDGDLLEKLLDADLDALVLESYGAGNAPTQNSKMIDALAKAIDSRNMIIVNCSQCHGGSVRQSTYGSGVRLAEIGVLSAGDMTPEAALTKLYCLLARGNDPASVRKLVQCDLAGELTEPVV